jgi:hypothetical protein
MRNIVLDRYAARCVSFVLIETRKAVLGARSAPRDAGDHPRALRGYLGRSLWMVSVAVVTVLTIADPAVHMRRAMPRQGVVRPSPERSDQIRRSLMAQIAVRDAEGLRAPTGAEAAALSSVASEDVQTVALPGGGVALLTSGAQLSMVVASRSEDGTMRVTHGAMPATPSGDDAKGGSHVR